MSLEFEKIAKGVFRLRIPELDDDFNRALLAAFRQRKDDPGVRKTHYFEGRYENLYLERACCAELDRVIGLAERAAGEMLGVSPIRAGFWFNEIPPGHRTLPHRHDDFDELLSGVYYVHVPEGSGRLRLGEGEAALVVDPEPGAMVFFPPDLMHEVETNVSDQTRLSIGMNFGRA